MIINEIYRFNSQQAEVRKELKVILYIYFIFALKIAVYDFNINLSSFQELLSLLLINDIFSKHRAESSVNNLKNASLILTGTIVL